MIGCPGPVARRLDPIFRTLAPGRGGVPPTPGRERAGGTAEEGYLHCGPSGAGHFANKLLSAMRFDFGGHEERKS